MRPVLTVKDVAELLSCHPNTVYSLVKKGEIPYVSIKGVGIRFLSFQIEQWIVKKSVDCSFETYDIMPFKEAGPMRRKNRRAGFGRIYTRRLKDGRIRFCADYRLKNGRRRRIVLKAVATLEEAYMVMEQMRRDVLLEYCGESKAIKFSSFAEEFIEKHSKLRRRSWRRTDRVFLAHLIEFFGGMEVSKITRRDVESYQAWRLNGKKKPKPSTVNREVSLLRTMMNKAVDWCYRKDNPVRGIKLLKEYPRERILTKEEEGRLLKVAHGDLKDIIILALATGMRKSEILGLEWRECDLERRIIKLRAERTKTSQSREIPLNEKAFEVLNRRQRNGSPYVFRNPETKRPYQDIKRSWSTALKRAGITDFRFHDLRHTVASRLAEEGISEKVIREILGHKSIIMTDRYTHANFEVKKKAIEKLERKGEGAGEA